jgi:biuret amidohydrolase
MTTAITPQGPIEIVDRSSMITKLNEGVVLRPRETAIVTIDMHRGHLDMEVATMAAKPDDAKRVIANAKEMLDLARAKGVPIVHVKLVFRKIPGLGSEGMTQPFWHTLHEMVTEEDRLTPGRRSTVDGHNIKGSRGTEIIPELLNDADYVIDNKKGLIASMALI